MPMLMTVESREYVRSAPMLGLVRLSSVSPFALLV